MISYPTNLVRYGFDPIVVEPYGSGSNGVLVVAESPGESEVKFGRPLYPWAPAGGCFTRLIRRMGQSPEQFRLTNTILQRPPGNRLEGTEYEAEAIATWRPYLQQEIERFKPKCILALGNVALKALTAYGGEKSTISHVRGYVLRSNYDTWLISTFHPSYIVQGGSDDSGVWIHDASRALTIARDGFDRSPTNYLCAPSLREWNEWVRQYDASHHHLAWDIETPESGKLDEEEREDEDISYNIIRASFCYEQGRAASVPWQYPYLDGIKHLLASKGIKLTWNGRLFDVPRVKANGCSVGGREHDLMWCWHYLQPSLRRALSFVAPFYCDVEPWKQLNDSEPEYYSAKDADVTWRIGQGLMAQMKKQGTWNRYEAHVVDVSEVLTKMSENGLPYSAEGAKEFEIELQLKLDERLEKLQHLVPEEVRPSKQKEGYKKLPKDLTGLALREFAVLGEDLTEAERDSREIDQFGIYKVKRYCIVEPFNPGSSQQKIALMKALGYKPGRNRKSKSESADNDAIEKIISKCRNATTKKAKEHLQVFEMIREACQLASVLSKYVRGWKPGKDGRIHATPGYWGAMHRISWRKPNIAATIADKAEDFIAAGFRKCVEAAPGKLLLESDWKGIEAVIVGWFAGDQDYIRLARIGVHDYMGLHMIGHPPDLSLPDHELAKLFKAFKKEFPQIRDDAKHTVHGQNYGMGPALMSQQYGMSLKRAKELQGIYFDLFPKIKRWQHSIMEQAYEESKLTNPYGYCMWFWDVFRWDHNQFEKAKRSGLTEAEARKKAYKLGDDAKSAVSFMPRDTAAGMLKDVLLKLRPLAEEGIMIASVHDSILCEVEAKDLDRVSLMVREAQEAPVAELGGLTIAVDQKVGQRWHESEMVPVLPLVLQTAAN